MNQELVGLVQTIGAPAIAVAVPILIFFVKLVIPHIPKPMLPVLAGVIGPAVEGVVAWIGEQQYTGVLGLSMGYAGVGLRELGNQLLKAFRGQSEPARPRPGQPTRNGR